MLGPEVSLDDQASFSAWVRRHGISPDDARAIGDQGIERLLIYRDLVRRSLMEALEASIPRTLARIGPLLPEFFDGFLEQAGPKSHYLRDVTREFLDFCETRWQHDPRIPAYWIELGRHESLHIEVASEPPRKQQQEIAELTLDSGLLFIEAARLVEYHHAVHELPDDTHDFREPEARHTRLFVYRDREALVRYLALTPMAATLVASWMRGDSLGQSLRSAAAEHRVALGEELISGAARLLSDLSERGAVLGPCRRS